MAGLRGRARDLRARLVDLPLRQLERARRSIIRGEADVLVLGESSCLFGSPSDPDPALLPELIGRELGGARIVQITGAGYNAALYAEMLRVLGTLDQRPGAVVVGINVRTSMMKQVLAQPPYTFTKTMAALAEITDGRRRVRSLGRGHQPTAREYAAYDAVPVHTHWSGDATIGSLRHPLIGQGAPPWPPEIEAIRFDLFHGEVLGEDHPRLDSWRTFGERARSYGVPLVAYQAAVPEERGETHFPGEFAAAMQHNRRLVQAALRETAGPSTPIVDPVQGDEDFADSRDASEHFALSGRLKIARGVAAALDAHPGWSAHR